MASQTTQPLSKAGITFFSSLCISTFSLGCWQSKRYFEKIELMKKRQNELQMEPLLSLESNAICSFKERMNSTSSNQDLQKEGEQEQEEKVENNRGYRPISIQGQFLHEYEILIGPRGPPLNAISSNGPNSGRSSGGMSSSPQGYYVITPFSRCNNKGIVLINRGWIPRQFVVQGNSSSGSSGSSNSWERPTGVINVIGIATQTEQPRFLSPPHNDKTPNQLLWFDRKALEMKTKTIGLSPLLLTETILHHKNDVKNNNDDDIGAKGFPIKPSIETVGEFKVLPSTHAGYAFTWFSLSGIGVYMTKKLISRGRA